MDREMDVQERKKEKVERHTDISLWFALLFLIGFGFALIREKTMGTPQAETR